MTGDEALEAGIEIVRTGLETLPLAGRRREFALRYIERACYKEIARDMGVSTQRVRELAQETCLQLGLERIHHLPILAVGRWREAMLPVDLDPPPPPLLS